MLEHYPLSKQHYMSFCLIFFCFCLVSTTCLLGYPAVYLLWVLRNILSGARDYVSSSGLVRLSLWRQSSNKHFWDRIAFLSTLAFSIFHTEYLNKFSSPLLVVGCGNCTAKKGAERVLSGCELMILLHPLFIGRLRSKENGSTFAYLSSGYYLERILP